MSAVDSRPFQANAMQCRLYDGILLSMYCTAGFMTGTGRNTKLVA